MKIINTKIDKHIFGFGIGFIINVLYNKKYYHSLSITIFNIHIIIIMFKTKNKLFTVK